MHYKNRFKKRESPAMLSDESLDEYFKRTKKPAKKHEETDIQIVFVQYAWAKYPDIRDRIHAGSFSNASTGIKVAMTAKAMGHSKGFPDVSIHIKRGKYPGFHLELKKSMDEVLRKDGDFRRTKLGLIDPHIEQQNNWIENLRSCGAYANYGFDLDHAIMQLDRYMNLKEGDGCDELFFLWDSSGPLDFPMRHFSEPKSAV